MRLGRLGNGPDCPGAGLTPGCDYPPGVRAAGRTKGAARMNSRLASWSASAFPTTELAAGLDPERYPNLIAMATMVGKVGRVPLDFTFGLDLLLDWLARRLE